jgi:hypothetical protein
MYTRSPPSLQDARHKGGASTHTQPVLQDTAYAHGGVRVLQGPKAVCLRIIKMHGYHMLCTYLISLPAEGSLW